MQIHRIARTRQEEAAAGVEAARMAVEAKMVAAVEAVAGGRLAARRNR